MLKGGAKLGYDRGRLFVSYPWRVEYLWCKSSLMQLPTRIKGLGRQIIDNTVYDKTFEEGNFRGSSTIIIKEGKVSWFAYKRLFQCSNLRSRKNFSGKTFAVSKIPKTANVFSNTAHAHFMGV